MALDLLPYQDEGAAFLARHSRAGLFDEMGVGKTAQAIRALDLVRAERVLVICPAAVREVWAGEFKKFARLPRKVLKAKAIDDLGLWLRGRVDVLLLSYEMATKWAVRIDGAADIIDVVIFDEAHYMKSDEANRTKALLGDKCAGKDGLARWGARVWFLTGTPAANDPIDIWPFLRFTGATVLPKAAFKKRYFNSRMGAYSTRHTPMDAMAPELRATIKALSLRRTKEQAGLMLPPIWLTTQTVDGDTAEIRALLREHPGMEKAVLEAVEKGGLSFLDAQHIATLRRLVGEAKAPAFVELLAQEMESGLDKVVVMGLHTVALESVRRGLSDRGYSVVHIDGSVGEADRMRAVERFQEDPETRVFVGNIKAAGTGLTLTAAADIIMFESSWSPADNAQAIMRIHRRGQTKECHARFISLADSIDEKVTSTVASKAAAIAKIGFGMVAA